jgi:hypothetical protein
MANLVLNSSLASGLGRPELAYNGQSGGAIQTGTAPITSPMAGSDSVSASGSLSASAPLLMLAVLVIGVAAFAYWVRPHLA